MNTQKKYTNARELILNQGWTVGAAVKKVGMTPAMYYYYKGKEPSHEVIVHGGSAVPPAPTVQPQPRAYNKSGRVIAFYGSPEDLARIFKGAL